MSVVVACTRVKSVYLDTCNNGHLYRPQNNFKVVHVISEFDPQHIKLMTRLYLTLYFINKTIPIMLRQHHHQPSQCFVLIK